MPTEHIVILIIVAVILLAFLIVSITIIIKRAQSNPIAVFTRNLQKANKLFKKNYYGSALPFYEKAVDSSHFYTLSAKHMAGIKLCLARCNFTLGFFDDARTIIKEAESLIGESADILIIKGLYYQHLCFGDMKHFTNMESCFRKVAVGNPAYLNRLIETLLYNLDFESAERVATEALEKATKASKLKAYDALIQIYKLTGKLEPLRKLVETADVPAQLKSVWMAEQALLEEQDLRFCMENGETLVQFLAKMRQACQNNRRLCYVISNVEGKNNFKIGKPELVGTMLNGGIVTKEILCLDLSKLSADFKSENMLPAAGTLRILVVDNSKLVVHLDNKHSDSFFGGYGIHFRPYYTAGISDKLQIKELFGKEADYLNSFYLINHFIKYFRSTTDRVGADIISDDEGNAVKRVLKLNFGTEVLNIIYENDVYGIIITDRFSELKVESIELIAK